MKKRILVWGGGWFGGLFVERTNAVWAKEDIADPDAVGRVLDEVDPEVVINCAGKTGRPNIDWCESHPIDTLRSNVAGPIILATECIRREVQLVHLGSGCVYEGAGPGMLGDGGGWCEEDSPNFRGSLYSRSKILSEQALKEMGGILQLRIRMPFDGSGSPRCLITKLVGYRSVISVLNSLTWVPDFITTALFLIGKEETGIWNVVNPGPMKHEEILELYKEIVDPQFTYETIPLEALSDRVKAGRSNCVLSSKKLEDAGLYLMPAKDALRVALTHYKWRRDAGN